MLFDPFFKNIRRRVWLECIFIISRTACFIYGKFSN